MFEPMAGEVVVGSEEGMLDVAEISLFMVSS